MRILISGSRNWKNYSAIRQALEPYSTPKNQWAEHTILSGCCSSGADRMAEDVARILNIDIEFYPAQWDVHGRAAGPMRNQHMIDTEPDRAIFFIRNYSQGATDCLDRARIAEIPCEIHRDGVVKRAEPTGRKRGSYRRRGI